MLLIHEVYSVAKSDCRSSDKDNNSNNKNDTDFQSDTVSFSETRYDNSGYSKCFKNRVFNT